MVTSFGTLKQSFFGNTWADTPLSPHIRPINSSIFRVDNTCDFALLYRMTFDFDGLVNFKKKAHLQGYKRVLARRLRMLPHICPYRF